MHYIIEWLNTNNGFAMALLTLVYVVATIFICIFNYQSALAARKQTEEAQKQFEESNRAKVIPRFIALEGQLYCLAFHNVGHTMAEHLVISVSKEWLDCLRRTQKNSDVADVLDALRNIEIFLPEGDKYLYSICIPADGTGDYTLLCQAPLEIDISYTSGNKIYSKKYILSMKGINSIINTSDYVRMKQKEISALKGISKGLKNISISRNSVLNSNTMEESVH